jgi:cytochrome b6
VAILPSLVWLLLGAHLLLVQVHGMHAPEAKPGERRRQMPFVPHFALRDLLGWTLALGVLAVLAALFPAELGNKADPFAPAFEGIRPEWYFLFMFETLKLVPGGEMAGVEYEALAILAFGLGGLVLVLVPFLDRGGPRVGRFFTWLGVVALAYVVGLTAWGYRSWVPFGVVGASAALLALLAYATRGGAEP